MACELSLHEPLLGIADLRHANKESRPVGRQADRRVLRSCREALVGRFDPRPRWDAGGGGRGRRRGDDVSVATVTSAAVDEEAEQEGDEDDDDDNDAGKQSDIERHCGHVLRPRRTSILFLLWRLHPTWRHGRRRRAVA